MLENFHTKIKKVAPKLMQEFCKIYGFYEYQNEFYSKYLLDATTIYLGYYQHGKIIKRLQDGFDGNLEPFKLEPFFLLEHLIANGYTFSIEPSFLNLKISYRIAVARVKDNLFKTIFNKNQSPNYERFNDAFNDIVIYAAQDFELSNLD